MSPLRQATAGAVSAALFLGASLSLGQPLPSPAEAASPDDEVLVNASKSPFSIDAKALQRAAAAFDKDRSLAPEAPLRFRARDRTPTGEALRIWIERGDAIETVLIDADGLLTLPQLAFADGARLLANRSQDGLSLFPEILSPSTSLHARRIGDLRLQCRVGWALELDEIPLYVRTSFAMAGGMCKSGKIAYHPYAGFRVSSAELRGITDSQPVPVTKGGAYRPPIHERSLNNDAIIDLK
jgi:hypothetical protein